MQIQLCGEIKNETHSFTASESFYFARIAYEKRGKSTNTQKTLFFLSSKMVCSLFYRGPMDSRSATQQLGCGCYGAADAHKTSFPFYEKFKQSEHIHTRARDRGRRANASTRHAFSLQLNFFSPFLVCDSRRSTTAQAISVHRSFSVLKAQPVQMHFA